MNQINNKQDSTGPPINNLDLYSTITSLWGDAVGAQHALLAGYIMAHSFLIAAAALLFSSLNQHYSTIVGISVMLVSVVGGMLSLQMALAWGRFVARVSLFEWHLQRMETQILNGPTLFTDWANIKNGKYLIDPLDNKNQFYVNWSVKHHKKWWASRARMVPILMAIMYLFFFSMSAINLASGSHHIGKSDFATESKGRQMIPDTTIICPLPGMGHCVRERCNFWDKDQEECTCDCFDTGGPGEAGSSGNPDWPCVISFYEDYD